MADAKDQDRVELARRALSRKTRTSIFSSKMPTKWHPTSVRNPDSGEPFTDDGCWEFVARAIERGEPVEEMLLNRPAGKRGFVLKLPGHGDDIIYVKLQLLASHVLGRSFHISTGQEDEDEDHD